MVIQLTVKNFRSFKDEVTFSMVAEPLKDNVTTLTTRDNIKLLPLAGIFGPNASGKSNLVKAFAFIHGAMTIANVNLPPTAQPMLKPFLLSSKTKSEPSLFEIVLWDEPDQTEYRYGFEINQEIIVSEWLEVKKKQNKNYSSKLVFERTTKGFTVSPGDKRSLSLLKDKVLPNMLAVPVFAQFAHVPSLKVVNLMNNTAIVDGHNDVTQLSLQQLYSDQKLQEKVVRFLQDADIAIKGIKINRRQQQVPVQGPFQLGAPGIPMMNVEGFEVLTTHITDDKSADQVYFNILEQESFGTQRLFGFAALLFRTLDSGGCLIVDEFGASMHPFISRAIVKVFQDKKSNPNNAQLIFCSHDTYLLSDEVGLRRDQIWFTEKDKKEQTILHSLSEFKTRSDLIIAKNYLEGRFGAVPVTRFGQLYGEKQ